MNSIDPTSRGIITDPERYYDPGGRAARRRQYAHGHVLAARLSPPRLLNRIAVAGEVMPRGERVSPSDPFTLSTQFTQSTQLAQLKLTLAQHYPDVRTEAGRAVQAAMAHLHPDLSRLDPDRSYFDVFGGAAQSHHSYNGWSHQGPPVTAMSLTDLQLRNFPADFGGDPTSLDALSGIYTEGAQGRVFDERNEIRLAASDVKTAIRAADFYDRYYDQLADFYRQYDSALQLAAQANLLNYADAARRRVDTGSEAGAPPLSDLALAMLSEAAGYTDHGFAAQRTKAYVFDINGYRSRDMSWLYAPQSGHVVLIIPNDAQPVRDYPNLEAMRADIATMAGTAAGRENLARHFSIYNRRDGQFLQGIDKWLLDIGHGGWNERIASAPSLVTGSVFENQVERMREDDLDNVHYLIRSNAQISRQELIQAFGAFNGVLGNPLTQSIELGLDIWEQRAAGLPEDHAQAVTASWRVGVGLGLNLLLSGLVGAGAMAGEGAIAGAGEQPLMRAPSRLPDGRTGYPLSPMDPPRLPGVAGVAGEDAPGPSSSGAAAVEAGATAGATSSTGMLPTGVVRNVLGMLERTDIGFLYRAVRASAALLHDPERLGFASSNWLEVPAMVEGPIVVTSSTKAGAISFGRGMWGSDYAVYQIDAQGLRAASLEENVEYNAPALSRHLGFDEDVVDAWKADGMAQDNVGEGALAYGEVHLSNAELAPQRIHRIPDADLDSILSGYVSESQLSDLALSSDDEH